MKESAWRTSMINKYGSEEKLKEHLRAIASKGGQVKTPKGFGSDIVGEDGVTGKERAVWAGKKGKKVKPLTKQ